MEMQHVIAFFIALAAGGLMVYFTAAPTSTVIVYPTPDNATKVEYRDKAGNCYRYSANKIRCPKTGAVKIPLQE